MNPALPLLALISLAGLLLRRREIGIPWAVCGLAGMALLAPALRIADGVPSPAATLAGMAPWQEIADPADGNPNLRDVTHQVQPWLLFLRHEMRAGRAPFWDPHQFSGSPYWSNGSGAPLFPLHLLFAALPLQIGLVLLPWLRIVTGGCGAWLLARELGLSRPAALLAALIFPLSGMITSFLLFPMANTHALVPWVLLAVERLANGRGNWPGLALAGGLQLLGGHPETPVFTALLAGLYLLVRGSARPVAAWGRFLAGWTVAAALAAIQILPLYRTLTGSGKWLHSALASAVPLETLAGLLLRLVLPDLFGNPADGTWWGPFNSAGTAIYAGAVTLPLAAAGFAAVRGDRRWQAVAVMTLFALVAAYQLFGMRHVLNALPVIQRGLHHYMKFGVELGLALLAAAGCQRWLEGKGRGLLAGAGVVWGLLAVAAWRFGGDWRDRGLLGSEIAWIAGIATAAVLLALSLRLPAARRWSAWPLLPAVLVLDLVAAHARTNPGLPAAKLYPVTGAVRFLQGRPERVAGLGTALHPDAAMVYGLYDVRGDSPVKLQRYDRVYATLAAGDPVYFHPIRNWRSPWLNRLGVRWVVAGPAEEPPPEAVDWRLAYIGTDARVWERRGAMPLVRLTGGARRGRVEVERRTPGAWNVAWQTVGSGRLVVAETWDPGWRASLNGRPVPVEPFRGVLMAVAVGPGSGRLQLRYHPDGFAPGVVLSLLGLAALILGTLTTPALLSQPSAPPSGERREKDPPCPSLLVRVRPCSPLPGRVGGGMGEGPGVRAGRGILLLLLLLALLAGCSGDPLPRDLHLREAVAAKRYTTGKLAAPGLWFARPPEPLDITFDGERRSTVLTAVDPWRWTGRVPEGAELHAGVQILPVAWDTITAFRAWVVARSGEESEVLDVVATRERRHPRWLDFTVDLSRWAGREVTLEFAAFMAGLPAQYRHANLVAWAPVTISAHEETAGGEPPNVLFILVDTLRFDHLTPYGYRRDTSPHMARLLAQPGAVVEEAYSQAPWTLPSVVSFLTGRYPGELLGDDPAAYGIPGGVPSLPETFRKLGYETGGFVANKTVHEGNGFGRGFLTFYSPPAETRPLDQPDAAALTSRVLPWLAAHRNAPFFLYVHYLDPHDPYDNPEIVNGRSPYLPHYRGRITGGHVHGIWGGRIPLDRPRRDTEHLQALYDSEIHYVDRFIGRLLDSIPPEVLANTLVVLTADHGEELFDHGGWKHGFTLYEEQIHVPLLVRWDGRVPAGTRLKGTVRLLDLAPTLAQAAGGKADPSWRGLDLMPALTGREPLPRRPAFAQHMMIGPLRAAAVLERKKLFLFNPRTPYAPADPLQAHLWSLDLERLHRAELYDLAQDPGERTNLAKDDDEMVARLQPVIHQQLDRQLPGLRVIASGLPAGSRLQGSLALDRPPHRWVSYFLAADDKVEMSGNRVTFDLGGEILQKGFLLAGDFRSVQALEARLDGRPLPAGGVRMGRSLPWGGSPLSAHLLTAVAPPVPRGPALRVWLPGVRRAPSAAAAPDPETEQRLRALGYIQ